MMLNMRSGEARYLYIYCLVRSSMHTKVRADREVDIGEVGIGTKLFNNTCT